MSSLSARASSRYGFGSFSLSTRNATLPDSSFTRLSCLQSDNEEKVEKFASRNRFFIHESRSSSWRGCSVRPNQIPSLEFPRSLVSIYLIRDYPERAFNKVHHFSSEFERRGRKAIAHKTTPERLKQAAFGCSFMFCGISKNFKFRNFRSIAEFSFQLLLLEDAQLFLMNSATSGS